MLEGGWVAACAIDIPGTYIIARMIFGRHPAVPFLLLLAISADAIGPGAAGGASTPSAMRTRAIGLALMAVAVGAAAALRQRGRQELLAVPARSGHVVLVGAVPGRRASRAGVWCRSCRFFPTGDAIEACSSSRRRRLTIR